MIPRLDAAEQAAFDPVMTSFIGMGLAVRGNDRTAAAFASTQASSSSRRSSADGSRLSSSEASWSSLSIASAGVLMQPFPRAGG